MFLKPVVQHGTQSGREAAEKCVKEEGICGKTVKKNRRKKKVPATESIFVREVDRIRTAKEKEREEYVKSENDSFVKTTVITFIIIMY